MNDIITAKSEKGRAIIDYLTRELGLPGRLRSLKVDVSSGVFVVDCQFLAPGSVESDEPRADTAGAIDRAARQLADAMGASEPGVLLDLQLVTTEVTTVGDPLPRFLYDIAISSRVVTN